MEKSTSSPLKSDLSNSLEIAESTLENAESFHCWLVLNWGGCYAVSSGMHSPLQSEARGERVTILASMALPFVAHCFMERTTTVKRRG